MPVNERAFKHGVGPEAVRQIARTIKRVDPGFADRAFVRAAVTGLEPLELKARVWHIVGALRAHLAKDPGAAITTVVRAGAAWERGDPAGATDGFAAWPLVEFVGEHGLGEFDASLEALRRLTGLFSAEFAIRAFLEADEARALRTLWRWCDDPDEKVRRLVSEGTRPRLPWGRRLRSFQREPAPVIELLERLVDDESAFVRRSVANNLNDIAKDHPAAVIAVCRRWAKQSSQARNWVIRRATRTLVKAGDPRVFALLGHDPAPKVKLASLSLAPGRLAVGEALTIALALASTTRKPQSLVIDYAIHHVKQRGARTAKVFKLKTFTLVGNATVSIGKRHAFREITTRRYYPGRHAVEILVNGRSLGMRDFELVVGKGR